MAGLPARSANSPIPTGKLALLTRIISWRAPGRESDTKKQTTRRSTRGLGTDRANCVVRSRLARCVPSACICRLDRLILADRAGRSERQHAFLGGMTAGRPALLSAVSPTARVFRFALTQMCQSRAIPSGGPASEGRVVSQGEPRPSSGREHSRSWPGSRPQPRPSRRA
jgi:hypothetical protein